MDIYGVLGGVFSLIVSLVVVSRYFAGLVGVLFEKIVAGRQERTMGCTTRQIRSRRAGLGAFIKSGLRSRAL